MIDIKLYKTLLKEWSKYGDVYSTRSMVWDRLKHFEKHCCPELLGKSVLELACNSGVFGYVICKYASSYIGVEPGALIKDKQHPNFDYFKQLEQTTKYIKMGKAFIFNRTVKDFLSVGDPFIPVPDMALVVNFALYHFSNEEIGLIEKQVFPTCKVVCIQNRNKKRESKRNDFDLWKPENIVEWLKKSGFECQIIMSKDKKYCEVIGKKP